MKPWTRTQLLEWRELARRIDDERDRQAILALVTNHAALRETHAAVLAERDRLRAALRATDE